jgi:putative addiction module component (TIGR02574 family)
MTQLTDRLLHEALALPEGDRQTLADELYASLDGRVVDDEMPLAVQAAWSGEIQSRIRDLVEGRVETIPGDVVKAHIAERLAAEVAAVRA